MLPSNTTKRLISTLSLGWLIFGGLGLGLRYAVLVPNVTVIIDQSYCPPDQWKTAVVEPYAALFKKSQARRQIISQVVVVTNIDHTPLTRIPSPDELGQPFGQPLASETLVILETQFPETVVLRCNV
ncbi:MAG: hypothetical protein AAF959_09230 [Cyanobacteria bacterium P01_D01_bin.56]